MVVLTICVYCQLVWFDCVNYMCLLSTSLVWFRQLYVFLKLSTSLIGCVYYWLVWLGCVYLCVCYQLIRLGCGCCWPYSVLRTELWSSSWRVTQWHDSPWRDTSRLTGHLMSRISWDHQEFIYIYIYYYFSQNESSVSRVTKSNSSLTHHFVNNFPFSWNLSSFCCASLVKWWFWGIQLSPFNFFSLSY